MFEALAVELNRFSVEGLGRRELCDVTAGVGRVRGALDALEVRLVAAVGGLDDCGGDAGSMIRAEGRCSKREASRRVRRAERLVNMPNALGLLSEGRITAEHADDLAKAAEATSEQLVDSDESLLGKARARPADMAGRDIRDWVRDHQSDQDRKDKHRRQRKQRCWKAFDGDDSMSVSHCRTDTVRGEKLRARVDEVANRLWREDGGRDNTNPDRRTWEQLRHDAFMIICGIDQTEDVKGSAGSGRNQVIITVDASTLTTGVGAGEIVGVGPLPTSVLEQLACDADLFGLIFGGDGAALWQSRATRTVTPAQWRALVARDRGCVICAAKPAYCEAHHITPWALGGRTDIDNLALVCTRHHHELHDQDLALARDGPNWTLKPRDRPQKVAA